MHATVMDETSSIYKELALQLGAQKFNIWFKNSTRLSLAQDYITISVPNKFIASWIENHFSEQVRLAVMNVTGQSVKIAFNIEPQLSGRKKGSKVSSSQMAQEEASSSNVPNKSQQYVKANNSAKKKRQYKLTLDDFIVGTCNKVAYGASKAVAENPENLFNPLFFHGSYGIGKTHLLQGVCNQVTKNKPNAKCIYVSAEEFTNQYVTSLKSGQLEKFRNKFRNADVLAIDDIHFLANKKSTQEEFLHTFNTIDLANKQVVLASDAHPKMIGQLTESLVSRFVSGMVVKLETPDYETRLEICRVRAKAMKIELCEEVLAYVARKITRSVREIEGAMLKLSAFSSVAGNKIDVHGVKQILSDSVTTVDVRANVADIKTTVAAYFEVTESQIASSAKTKNISLARSVCMYLVRELSNLSYPEIGRMIGNKNHATVIQANKKITKCLSENAQLSWKSDVGIVTRYASEIVANIKQSIGV